MKFVALTKNCFIMKKQYLWLALTLGFGLHLTAQNKFQYSYKEYERTFTWVNPEVQPTDLSFLVWERLAPQEYWRTVEERINMDYQREQTILLDSTTFSKSYFELPAKIEFGHYIYTAYDKNNNLVFQDSVLPQTLETSQDLAAQIAGAGYHPGLSDFVRPSNEVLGELTLAGFSVNASDPDELVIKDPGGLTTIYNFAETSIHTILETPDAKIEVATFYDFFQGIGFLPVLQQKASREYELDSNVIFYSEIVYTEHEVTDYVGILKPSQTVQNNHLRLFPVPMQTELTIELINLPNDEIRGILIRDFQGNPVQTISGNSQTSQTISLQGVPSGFITIEVSTIGGVQSRLSLKH
jgi:hypothetical protein